MASVARSIFPVVGVGKVILKVRVLDIVSGTREVILHEVLHIPEMKYGIICQKQLELRENQRFHTRLDVAGYPNGVVFDNDGKQVVVFNHTQQLPSPQDDFTPPAGAVTVYTAPRHYRLGPSTFQDIINNGPQEPWAGHVTVEEEFWPVITEAYSRA